MRTATLLVLSCGGSFMFSMFLTLLSVFFFFFFSIQKVTKNILDNAKLNLNIKVYFFNFFKCQI